MKDTGVKFPDSPMPLDALITIQAPKPLGLVTEIFTREKARQLDLYDYPVTTGIMGEDKDGKKIKVNSVGRWFFGVPGYGGRVRIASDGNKIFLRYPSQSPDVVHEFVDSLKEFIEI